MNTVNSSTVKKVHLWTQILVEVVQSQASKTCSTGEPKLPCHMCDRLYMNSHDSEMYDYHSYLQYICDYHLLSAACWS